MKTGGESGSWFRQSIWNPFINNGVYAYQEWVDEGVAKVVPESKDNIGIPDRAAVVLAGWVGLWTAPVSVPLVLAGCALDGETKNVDERQPEPDTYTPPAEGISIDVNERQPESDTYTPPAEGISKDVNEWQPEPDTYTPPAECISKEEIPYNNIDEDCDGYDLLDVDGDGYCKADEWIKNKDYQCPQEEGAFGSDCNDGEYLAYPEAVEICNGKDNDCDGEIDCTPVCIDKDKDGYGKNCELGDDCDDTNSQIFPGAFEFCNNKDDNCNGLEDENYNVGDTCKVGIGLCINSGKDICSPSGLGVVCDAKPLLPKTEIGCDGKDQDCDGSDFLGTDKDGDGYKIEGGACGLIDCNDSNPKINPGVLELCNNIDDNCNGHHDENYDLGDACKVGVGLCINSGKDICSPSGLDVVCDAKPLSPEAEIGCDGKDQDCDGSDFLGTDKDGDGYKIEGGACGAVDCDDANPQIFQGALELCNNKDDNCNGLEDENYNVGESCTVGIGACANTGAYVCTPNELETVCNVAPLKPQKEIPCDGIDQDCDGFDLSGTDADGDGYSIEGGACGDIDCDDTSPQIFPGALELCNNIDDNCDGKIDEDYNIGESCTVGVGACANTGAYVCASNELETVCNVAPLKSQDEIACDGIDQDCDGSDYLGADLDGDGYTAEGGLCGVADCNDNNANIHPATLSEAEMGLANDGIDNNCDGYVDEIDVNGIELTLSNASGNHGYIHIHNGGKLKLADSSVSWTAGDLTIDAGSILDISGVTCGSGNGYSGGGSADGGGGSGASHVQPGGSGGYGGWSGYGYSGGPTYGSTTDLSIESGSCGGNGGVSGAAGGYGGGAISISANNAFIYGAIYADGKNGTNAPWDDGGGGGGSGGGIFVSANNIYVDTSTTKLTVRGGNGGNGGSYSASGGGGGGGGAGGTIKLSFSSAVVQGAIYEIYGSEFCCGFANRLLEYEVAQTDGGFGGGQGCGYSKCGQPGGNGGYGTVNGTYF